MMTALSEWLKQVIAVVLLASLVDLLLPNKTMQRYVRLIAGLFILLTLIGPMLSWVKSDFGTKLADSIESIDLRPGASDLELAQIEENASKLRMSREEQAASLASAQLAAQIRQTVETEGKADVRDVRVKATPDGKGGLQVESVAIVLAEPSAAGSEQDGSAGAANPIREVAPVIIDLGEIGRGEGTDEDRPVQAEAETEETEEAKRFKEQVAALVSARYGMGTDRISIMVDGAATKS
ncbi:stage III sporulation protein AF [Cohnella sp. AR92]|uniref:stage III sporulation protein AF n=1 Tax=Cohnella sp. AR92 TaxID=648716 RepID=UPI000F8CD7E3|nr:stage III sporulation protein AF [Cohnella sp. AR92]RUS48062.1 stage III sporulation protein AF [Cohnella sp. AR92]